MGWYNSDGLYVKFGTEEATVGVAGEYRTNGPLRMTEVTVTATSIPASASSAVLDYNVVIPLGAFIEKVEVETKVAVTSGGSATLDIGGMRTDTTTADDFDGFIAALAIASFNAAGEAQTLTQGSTGAGAYIGTTLARNVYLTSGYLTAAFTAGTFKVRIYFSF